MVNRKDEFPMTDNPTTYTRWTCKLEWTNAGGCRSTERITHFSSSEDAIAFGQRRAQTYLERYGIRIDTINAESHKVRIIWKAR